MAEMERFELSQALTPLPLFESGPFNHLGTSPCLSQHQLLPGNRGELMGRTKKIMKLYIPQKPCNIKDFAVKTYQITSSISSQPRYDRFDTAPYILHCLRRYNLVVLFDRHGASPVMSCCGAQNLLLAYARQILTAATPYASLYPPQAALGNGSASIPLHMKKRSRRKRLPATTWSE